MICPQCRVEYREGSVECADCHVALEPADESNLDVLIRTGVANPIAIGLAKSLFQEAGIRFFEMDQNLAARQESGNFLGWWNVRVSQLREAEAREILQSVEQMK